MRNSSRTLHRPSALVPPWRPPAGEKSVYFNTVGSDYISFADPPRIVDNSTDFFFEVVIRPRAAMGVYDTPVSKHTLTQGVYFSTDNPVTKVFFAIDDVDVGLTFPVAAAGEARYYSVSYVSSTLYGYSAPYDGTIGGVLSTVGTAFPAAPTTTNAAVEIGGLSAQAGFGVGFQGEVLWFRWWNKGKSPSEVNYWWNRRLIPGERPPKDLAFWWDAAMPRRDLVSGLGGTFNGTVSQNPTYAHPRYFWTARDRLRTLPLLSIEAGSTNATATGAPSLPFFNASGTGAQTQSATGAPNLPKLNAAGSAVMLPSATGAPSLPFLNASGVAVQTQAATGAPSLPFLSAAGVAVTGANTATGAPSLPFISAAGVAVQTQAATGAPNLPKLSASGTAVMLPSATGAPSLPFLSAAGTAIHTQSASGAPALPFLTTSGVAVFGSAATGSGTPSLPFLNTAGTATQTQTATGTPSLPFLSAAGTAIFGSAASATGAPNLPKIGAAGTAVQTHAATGTPSLPFLSASGVAVLVPKATGAPSLPFLSASGSSVVRYTATGAANLPRLGASGVVFFGDALGVIVEALARWSPAVSANARYARDVSASARNE